MTANDSAILYRTIWRWHFYAGIFSIPFVVVLCITGTIYLYKPQFEAWVDWDVNHLGELQDRKPPSIQVESAISEIQGTFVAFELAPTNQGATRVDFRKDDILIRAYVDPATSEIVRTALVDRRFMNIVKKIHGELLIGDLGSYFVEIAACWTLVMVLSGIYLWWPRNNTGIGGVLYPRFTKGSKMFWRDIHSVIGIWISVGVVLLIATGLPWTSLWGEYFRWGRQQLGIEASHQQWSTRSSMDHRRHEQGIPDAGPTDDASGNPNKPTRSSHPISASQLKELDQVVLVATQLNWPPPVVVQPPSNGDSTWVVRSMTQNRPWRRTATIDGTTGAIIHEETFNDKHWIDQAVGIGIAAHEGQLFGIANQIVATVTTVGLMGLSISGLILWLRRKKPNRLGAPEKTRSPPFSIVLFFCILLIGLILPAFGASIVVVCVFQWTITRRMRRISQYLGLE